MFEYDSVHDKWIRRSNMLFAKSNFSLCSVNDKIYSFGGIALDTDRIDIVECYDIEENKWTYIGSMPIPFISGSVIFHDGLFYICGGRIGVGRINSCYTFNPESKEWNQVASMRIGRFNFGVCCINENSIFVIGGQRYLESEQSLYTREALSSVEIYDIYSDQWSIGPSTPYPIYNPGICLIGNDLFVCGTTEHCYDNNSEYRYMFTGILKMDVISREWTIIENNITDLRTNYRCISAQLNTRKLKRHVSGENKKET